MKGYTPTKCKKCGDTAKEHYVARPDIATKYHKTISRQFFEIYCQRCKYGFTAMDKKQCLAEWNNVQQGVK